MSVIITFHMLSEKQPKHGESIIWLKNTSSFGFEGYTPKEVSVEYVWEEIDDNGEYTGSSICYNADDGQPENTKLAILADGWILNDDDLWISTDDYWECFNV